MHIKFTIVLLYFSNFTYCIRQFFCKFCIPFPFRNAIRSLSQWTRNARRIGEWNWTCFWFASITAPLKPCIEHWAFQLQKKILELNHFREWNQYSSLWRIIWCMRHCLTTSIWNVELFVNYSFLFGKKNAHFWTRQLIYFQPKIKNFSAGYRWLIIVIDFVLVGNIFVFCATINYMAITWIFDIFLVSWYLDWIWCGQNVWVQWNVRSISRKKIPILSDAINFQFSFFGSNG